LPVIFASFKMTDIKCPAVEEEEESLKQSNAKKCTAIQAVYSIFFYLMAALYFDSEKLPSLWIISIPATLSITLHHQRWL
jgi:hypothetical protein